MVDGSHFVLMATGQIEAGNFEGNTSLFCRYAFAFGDDWAVVRGVEEGITQMSSASGSSADGQLAVWNFPVDITFRATCPFGWPQLVVAVYGTDYLGNSDVILGYGAMHLPMCPGRHTLRLRTFRPLASSIMGRFQSWFNGKRPEFTDALFPSKAEGRDVTSVQSFGSVKVVVDITVQGLQQLGYELPSAPSEGIRLSDSL